MKRYRSNQPNCKFSIGIVRRSDNTQYLLAKVINGDDVYSRDYEINNQMAMPLLVAAARSWSAKIIEQIGAQYQTFVISERTQSLLNIEQQKAIERMRKREEQTERFRAIARNDVAAVWSRYPKKDLFGYVNVYGQPAHCMIF